MIKLNIHEAKTHLSRYLDQVIAGEVIILCKHNKPIAEIRSIDQKKKNRPIGLHKGQIIISEAFYDPLPKEEEDLFYSDSL